MTESERCELVQSSCKVSDPVYTVQWGACCGTGTVVYFALLGLFNIQPTMSVIFSVLAYYF